MRSFRRDPEVTQRKLAKGTVRRIAAYHPSEKIMNLRKESADGSA